MLCGTCGTKKVLLIDLLYGIGILSFAAVFIGMLIVIFGYIEWVVGHDKIFYAHITAATLGVAWAAGYGFRHG